MLSRRHLRVKVMQALYAHFQSESPDLYKTEKDLFSSLDKLYELYLYKILFLLELADVDRTYAMDSQLKHRPDANDLISKGRFFDNRIISAITDDTLFAKLIKDKKISWQKDIDQVKKVFKEFRNTPEYLEHINISDRTVAQEKDFLIWVYKKFLSDNELLEAHFEDKSIFWSEDQKFIDTMVIKTIKAIKEGQTGTVLMAQFRDPEDDVDFCRDLLRGTIRNDKDFETEIAEKTKNWEVERIALMDIILLKMSLSEILNFSAIPVKVSINEYIDISKDYSTPKSRVFINGVLDKLVTDRKNKGDIKKSGRGLME